MFDKLVDLLVSCLHLFQFWEVLPEYAEGVILRLGKFHRFAKRWNWMFPFHIEVLLSANVLPETVLIGPQSITTQDDKSIVVSTVVTFKITKIKKFLLHVDGAKQAIEDTVIGITEQLVRSRTWLDLLNGTFHKDLTVLCPRAANKYGVEIISVQLADFTRSRSYRILQQAEQFHKSG